MAYNNSLNFNITGVLTLSSSGVATGSLLTENGLLLGSTSNAITSLSVASNGTILSGVTSSDSAFTATPTVTSITLNSTSTLSNYVALTSWTPVLKFGGASTGITYGTQSGTYSRIGSMVSYRATIILTAKGSSTGSMSVTGMPLSPSNFTAAIVRIGSGITDATGSFFQAAITSGGNLIIERVVLLSGSVATLSNTAFSDTSEFEISGMFII